MVHNSDCAENDNRVENIGGRVCKIINGGANWRASNGLLAQWYAEKWIYVICPNASHGTCERMGMVHNSDFMENSNRVENIGEGRVK